MNDNFVNFSPILAYEPGINVLPETKINMHVNRWRCYRRSYLLQITFYFQDFCIQAVARRS